MQIIRLYKKVPLIRTSSQFLCYTSMSLEVACLEKGLKIKWKVNINMILHHTIKCVNEAESQGYQG